MNKSFLLCSGFLFIGGALLAIVSILGYSDTLWVLSIVLMLMGGIPLVCLWCRDLFKILPDTWKDVLIPESTSDNSNKEEKTNEDL